MKKNIVIEERMTQQQVEKYLSGDSLDMSIRHFTTIENISHLTALKTLNLGFNNITSVVGISTLVHLQKLYLQHNLIEQIKGLEKNKNLRIVNLMNNKIEKIQGLNGLVRMEHLNLSNNKINKLQGIQSQKLVSLNLNNNIIQSLDYMSIAPKLQELLVSNNKLVSVNPKIFKNCSKIIKLDLSKNNLKTIKFIECLSLLEQVNLSYNQIQSIDLESCFQYLETLFLNNNKILELPYLSNIFPELMTFDISYNILTSQITLVQAITNLDSLINISFNNNPFYEKGSQQKYAKIFKLEVINGKQFLKAGQKYAGQINDIVEEWKEFPELYMRDNSLDEEDIGKMNQIKKDGFYDQNLEMLIIGEVTKRPNETMERYHIDEDRMKHHQQMFNQIQDTSNRINYLRLTYRQILKKNGIPVSRSEMFITNKQMQQQQNKIKNNQENKQKQKEMKNELKSKGKGQVLAATMSLNEMNRITEAIRAERRQSVQKWKQLKSKDKFFNIRDSRYGIKQFRKKIQSKEQESLASTKNFANNNRQKPNLSLPKIISRTQKPSSKFIKTQTNHFVATPIEKVSQSYRRPLSVKKI